MKVAGYKRWSMAVTTVLDSRSRAMERDDHHHVIKKLPTHRPGTILVTSAGQGVHNVALLQLALVTALGTGCPTYASHT